MRDEEVSRTALATAYLRAAHQLLDGEPRILEDDVALKVLGAHAEQHIMGSAERYRSPVNVALRSHVVLRSRFTEDRLAAAVERGIRQYIIVGAGFDTFALRQPAWAADLQIIEVDHPATQAVKRARIADAGFDVPDNLTFADINFEQESLADGLARHSIARDVPTFFAWLGVTMYLTEAAIDTTLKDMALFPKGSELVVTFMQPPETGTEAGAVSQLSQRVANGGEPFVSYFTPEAFKDKLTTLGFKEMEFLTPEAASKKYYQGGLATLLPPRRTGIVAAIVK